MSKLAICGGEKIRKTKFPPYTPIGEKEFEEVKKVFKSNIFSGFLGCWHENFSGGQQVQALEREWAEFFGVKHAISVNSATSGLYCAVGALGIEPFDEIIVSPYTMCASAMAPLIYNAIPVFADIEPDCFCLDVDSVEEKITDRTRAIIVVDIFGQPYDADHINSLARKHNLKVIEDCAQAPYAKLNRKFAGTLGDVGVYSLNYHKHIHSGEGGIVVTNDDSLTDRLRLIRNHAEAVVEAKGETNLVNMMGFNYRMIELEAAIVRHQLKRLPQLVEERRKNVCYLEERISQIPCLIMPKIRDNAEHVYYKHSIKFNEKIAGIPRNKFVEALKAELMPMELRETEGVKIECGYTKPLYLQPIFQKQIAYGSKGFPWSASGKKYDYSRVICPVAEDLYFSSLVAHEYMHSGMTKEDLDDVGAAFIKVWENLDEIAV